MAHVNRRIGKSSETANTTPDGTGGGVLDAFLHDYFQRSGNVFNAPGLPQSGMTATGGVISDYADGGIIYRAHIFTTSGTFTVTAPGDYGDTIQYLLIGGGGSGGGAGGGGAGGFVTNIPGYPAAGSTYDIPAFPKSYTVEIGAGGARVGAPSPTSYPGNTGNNTNFYPTPVSHPHPQYLRATGGGGGGGYNSPKTGSDGASGAGGGQSHENRPPYYALAFIMRMV